MDKKKRLKRIKSLERQKEKHRQKMESYTGKKDYLKDYWEKEIARFNAEIMNEKKRLKSD